MLSPHVCRCPLRKAFSDRELVDETLRDGLTTPWGPVLSGYAKWLEQQPLSVRTFRMYIRVAARLCDAETLSSSNPLSTKGLARFLSEHPGARANAMKFVTYTATQLDWSAAMPAKTSARSKAVDERRLQRFQSLYRAITAKGVERASPADLTELLSRAFVIPQKVLKNQRWSLRESPDRLILHSGQDDYEIPRPLWGVAKRWIALKPQALDPSRTKVI